MHKLKQKILSKNIFHRGAIFILALLILGLAQTTHAVTFDYTGYLSADSITGEYFLGEPGIDPSTGNPFNPISGSFSFSAGVTPDGTSTYLNHPSGLTGFSLSVNGMTIWMQDATANVEIWNNKSTWGTDALEDRIEFLPPVNGNSFTDNSNVSWVPYQADFRLRYQSHSDINGDLIASTALTSTALPQNINLNGDGRIATVSDIRLAYYQEGWAGDESQRPRRSQYIKIDYIGQLAPAPVPEPGTLLLLGSGLTGLFFFRKKKA